MILHIYLTPSELADKIAGFTGDVPRLPAGEPGTEPTWIVRTKNAREVLAEDARMR
jgi:hypothetical protein